jgi:thiol-disulfide isomerase/thioredoxin
MRHENMKHGIFKPLGQGLAALCLAATLSASAAYETEDPVDFSLMQLGGGEVSLSDYRDSWVVVNYWATWCAPCRKEMPELSDLHDERDDLTVLGLAFEDIDDSAFEEFLLEFQPSYPILRVDVYQPPEPFGAPRVLPTTIILDREGRAVKAFLGPVTRAAIEEFIDSTAGADEAAGK